MKCRGDEQIVKTKSCYGRTHKQTQTQTHTHRGSYRGGAHLKIYKKEVVSSKFQLKEVKLIVCLWFVKLYSNI